MRLLVTGARGQVGWELTRSLMPLGEVVALDRARLDLADLANLASTVRSVHPDVIVNAAAYTAVDRAETEEDLATRINGDAVGILAEAAAECGALLVHYSTDYVFDGSKSAPYDESDATAPLNAYGRSKLRGEEAIRHSSCDWLIFRTTWVYGARGNNFLQTILRLARDRDMLRIIADQHGAPTPARFLADVTVHVVQRALRERQTNDFVPGLYHLSAAGETTWHGFASAIVEAARQSTNPPPIATRRIEAIGTDEYPTAATRPRNSMLDQRALRRTIPAPSPGVAASARRHARRRPSWLNP